MALPQPSDRPLLLPLFGLFLGVYALTSGGHFYASDDVQKLAVLDALWQHGTTAIPDGWVHGADGLRYAWFPPGASALMLPGWALGKLLGACFPMVPVGYATRFCVALENAALSGGLVALQFAFARRLGASARQALFGAVALGLGTMVWPYAKTAWSEPGAALLLYGGLYACWGAARDNRGPWGAGLLLGAASSVRQELALVAVGVTAWWAWRSRGRDWFSLWLLLAPMAAVQAGILGYDAMRDGSPWIQPSYKLPLAQPGRLSEGRFGASARNLYQYTFSPNQGVAWYSPAVWLGGLGAGWHPAIPFFLAGLGPLAAFYVAGWGLSSWAWGLRYSYVFLPALLLSAARAWRPGRRALALALLTGAVAVQLLALVPNPIDLFEHELARVPGLTIRRLMLEPAHAPLRLALHEAPGLLRAGAGALSGHLPTGTDPRLRRGGLPDVWWVLVLLEPVPRGLVALAVAAWGMLALISAFLLARALPGSASKG